MLREFDKAVSSEIARHEKVFPDPVTADERNDRANSAFEAIFENPNQYISLRDRFSLTYGPDLFILIPLGLS